MEYPDSVITENKKGEREVRNLISTGKFVKYNYIDPKRGKQKEKGKFSIILKTRGGGEEHYFMIPLKGRFLAIPRKEEKQRKIWDSKNKKAVKF